MALWTTTPFAERVGRRVKVMFLRYTKSSQVRKWRLGIVLDSLLVYITLAKNSQKFIRRSYSLAPYGKMIAACDWSRYSLRSVGN